MFVRVATLPVAIAMLHTSHTSSKQVKPIAEYVHKHKQTLTKISLNFCITKFSSCAITLHAGTIFLIGIYVLQYPILQEVAAISQW